MGAAMEPGGARPTPAFPPPDTPRFKVWDALVVFLAGQILGAGVGFAIGYALSGDEVGDAGGLTLACGLVGQFVTYGVVIWLYCRGRGTGSARRDLGLLVRARDWWAIPLGTGCAIGFGLLVFPLQQLVDERQSVVDDLNDAGGAELAVIAIAAGLLAPVFEELLFRGLLLRALGWIVSDGWAIGISAVVFGAVHLLGGNVLGTLVVIPALVGLGVVSGVLAVRSGNLSQSILLHVGFNLIAVVGAIAS